MKTKTCTTITQSRELIRLGVDVSTADMCYYYDHDWSNEHIEIPKVWDDNYEQFAPENEEDNIPAWSLSALFRLMPDIVHKDCIGGICIMYKTVSGKYRMAVDRIMATNVYDDPIDAAYELVVWLLKNNNIQNETN